VVDKQLSTATLNIDGGHLFVGTGSETALELLELQPEGKKRMTASDFISGYRPQTGEKFGM
jgi:methionyl-tRNA formyltransferase